MHTQHRNPRSSVQQLSRPLAAALAMTLGNIGLAEVSLPAVFSDHMVLQRQLPVPVWGMAEPGEVIQVEFAEQRVETTAGSHGEWAVVLDPMPASTEGRTLTVIGENRIEIQDVLVGEVWVCGGQSNMEWTVAASSDPKRAQADANRPTLRVIKAPHRTATHPEFTIDSKWVECTPRSVVGFTAVGYSFGRDIQDNLDVPIGLLSINWGGTRIEPWISEPTLAEDDISSAQMRQLRSQIDAFHAMSDTDREQRARQFKIDHDRQVAGYLDRRLAADPGLKGKWFNADFDDQAWDVTELPRLWKNIKPALAKFDGNVWFRKTIEIPEDWNGRKLRLQLGSIDDSDIVWFNGIRIGSTIEAHSAQRAYDVNPALVKSGTATIAVLAIDSGGAGGLTGPANRMRLAPTDRKKTDEAAVPMGGDWKWRQGAAHTGPRPRSAPQPDQEPGRRPTDYAALNKGMISPFAPYAVRGAIWYQGESNAGESDRYRTFMPMLIGDWQRTFKREAFPFGIVQLAAFRPYQPGQPAEGGWAFLREAQSNAAKTTPDTGLIVTTDIGDAGDIHPRNKREVGRRLALWALTTVYGKDVGSWSGPVYAGSEKSARNDGIKGMIITFDHVDGGLKTRDGKALGGFAISGPSGQFRWAKARIIQDDGGVDKVFVWSPEVPDPVAVRYAWQNNPEPANLVNAAGLPADGFRTDN
ncbi:MAG: hypothetical protein MK085_07405 [Phycisphaerales bacterium]|nr:hypothetical protein [Phycisphaerales bacterium]